MAIIKKTKKYLPHHSWSFTITSNHPPDPEDYHLQHVPPKKNSLHPPKTNILYPKIPPPNGKKRYTSNPKLPLLGSFKKPKTFSPFRGFEPPTVFFQNRSLGLGKKPKAHEGIAGRLPCQIPIHRLQVGGLQGRRLGGSTWCPGSVGVFVCRFIFMEPKRKKTKTEVVWGSWGGGSFW